MKEEKQLSLCFITKNDEAFLPDCLNRMNGVADEILVADIGSGDRTPELAEKAGATVYQPKWEDNFSTIKNFCMERALGKWVLFLQADEIISSGQLKKMKFLLKNPNAEGYLLYSGYDPKERNVTSHSQFLRLIRNRNEYRFRYRSFEYIPDETLYSVCDSHLCITHCGEKTIGWQLEERKRLLEVDLKEHQMDGYVQYLKGIELLNQERYEESATSFERARQMTDGGYFYGPQMYKCLGVSLLSLEQYEKAEKALSEGLQLFPFYNDLLVLHAELCRQLGRKRDALENLKTCLALRKRPNLYVPGSEIDSSIIQGMLEEIESSQNQEAK